MVTITQVNNRYFFQFEDGERLHILNQRSLSWNLKHVFKFSKEEVIAAFVCLEQVGTVQFDIPVAA